MRRVFGGILVLGFRAQGQRLVLFVVGSRSVLVGLLVGLEGVMS